MKNAATGVPLFDLGGEYLSIKTEADEAIRKVMASGHYILGPEVERLEADVAKLSRVRFAVGVNSGTDALTLILKALGIGPGDEVVTTPFTFFAAVEAILHAGAKPVFCDIDPATFNIDPAKLPARLARAKAVLAVHLYGQMADMKAIGAAAKKAGVPVIEDMAQALGAAQNGKPAGSLGQAAALSFYPTKNLGACGDAGMILTNDEALAARARRLRSHGSDVKYRFDEVGYNSRLDELQAAILNVKLSRFPEWTEKRIALARTYDRLLKGSFVVRPAVSPGNRHTYHLYTIRSTKRDALKDSLKKRGVDSGVHYPSSLHLAPALKNMGYKAGDFPESEKAAREVLSLPLHGQMTEQQVETVAQTIHEFTPDH